jgi:hypothetical protein
MMFVNVLSQLTKDHFRIVVQQIFISLEQQVTLYIFLNLKIN